MAKRNLPADKRCNKCGETKPRTEFNKSGPARHNLVMSECRECMVIRRREYRAENHEKILASERKYNETHKHVRAAYRRENAAQINERCRLYREANPIKVLAASQRWRDANPGKVRTQQKSYRSENAEYFRFAAKKRRALKKGSSGVFTLECWQGLVARSTSCHWCKKKWTKTRRPTVDHVTPLSKGGTNDGWNIVCSCNSCNNRKHAKLVNPITAEAILL